MVLICGAKLLSAAVKFVEASLHALLRGTPAIGQVSRFGGGGGTVRVPSLTCAATDWLPWINVWVNKATGTKRMARSTTLQRTAASPPHPPNAAFSSADTGDQAH